jgi:hypothetical protein
METASGEIEANAQRPPPRTNLTSPVIAVVDLPDPGSPMMVTVPPPKAALDGLTRANVTAIAGQSCRSSGPARSAPSDLSAFTMPTLIANGDNDRMLGGQADQVDQAYRTRTAARPGPRTHVDGVQCVAVGQTGGGGDGRAVLGDRQCEAADHPPAAEEHRARPALPVVAARFGVVMPR